MLCDLRYYRYLLVLTSCISHSTLLVIHHRHPATSSFHSTPVSRNFHFSSVAALAYPRSIEGTVAHCRRLERKAADWNSLRYLRRCSGPKLIADPRESENTFASMGFSFRFGYKDWFDFSFRFGPRKLSQKSNAKEVLLQSKYHVRCHGPKSRHIEMKNDTVSLMNSLC